MARPPSGPIGNSPRDLRDDFVGDAADPCKGGAIPTKTRGPTRVTGNSFHAKVSGKTPGKRADREPHFRRGGFVRR
jgi:hypothetical protein